MQTAWGAIRRIGAWRYGWAIVAVACATVALLTHAFLGWIAAAAVAAFGAASAQFLVILRQLESRSADIEQQARAIEAKEERQRAVLDSVSEVIFQTDPHARLTFLNASWEAVAGFPVEESLGRHVLDFIHPAERDAMLSFFAELTAQQGTPMRRETRGVRRDGIVRWVELFVRATFDESGVMTGSSGTINDITERKVAEMRLADAEEKYRMLVERLPVVTYQDQVLGDQTRNIYLSPQIVDLIGYSPREWQQDPKMWDQCLHPDDKELAIAEHQRCVREKRPLVLEYRLMHREGHWVWLRDEAHVVTDAYGQPVLVQGILYDITERKTLEEQLSHQAFHDALTGLANRSLFTDRVQHALAQRRRPNASPMAVLFMDLDDFKTINDSLGHAAGDDLLRAVAQRVEGCLRAADTAARLGGDEFGILIEILDTQGDAEFVAQRIATAVTKPISIAGHEIIPRPSIGIAITDDREITAEELLRNADLAMYMAKASGKGGYTIFQAEMHAVAVDRLRLKGDLESAIDAEQLFLRYQPIVDPASGRVAGAEALVRWLHPERGIVAPLDFIPLAEEMGAIDRLGLWVLQEACRQGRRWQAQTGRDDLTVTVNVSSKQLARPDFARHVRDVLEGTGFDPGCLVLEITESALMLDIETTTETLRDLKAIGLRLAVDDFGTGYSSLSYLHRFPLDILKVDRSFVSGLEGGAESSTLAQAVIKLGQSLGLAVVAEGVETQGQARALVELGCTRAQGYLFGKPAAPEALGNLLKQPLQRV